MVINSNADIINAIQKLALNDLSVEDIKFGDGLNYAITLKGKNWDGKLDATIAKIIIQIQELIFTSYSCINKQSIRKVKSALSQELRVTVDIKNGSSIINIDIGKAVEELFKNLTPLQSFIVALFIIGSITSVISFSMYLSHLEKMADKKNITNSLQMIEDTIKREQKISDSLNNLAKSISNSMDKNDSIIISSTGEVLSKKEFKNRFPKIDENHRTEYIDGKYKFFQLNTKNIYKAMIEDSSGATIKASVMLSKNDIEVLTERLLDHEFIDIQINATVDDNNKIIKADIIKLDTPREDAIAIVELQ